MRTSLAATREALSRLLFQRCFYLFFMLLILIVIAPLLEERPGGALITNAINAFIILSAVAAVGRTVTSFIVVLLLAVPAIVCRWLSLETGDGTWFDLSLRLHAAVYATTIALLLRYVFDQHVMTSDRLWGAASAYLLIGVLWSLLYAMVDRAAQGSFMVRGAVMPLQFVDVIYFSFSTLTTTGFGDIVPIGRAARICSMLESIIGQLFIAILIARLVGVYPPRGRDASALRAQVPSAALERGTPASLEAP